MNGDETWKKQESHEFIRVECQQHLNVLLAETEDITEAENAKKLGLIIIRGDNVVLIFCRRVEFFETAHG
jgi:hypothetical protein